MKTALITGASEGIGYAFAQCFIRDGYNVVLVARNEAKLQSIVEAHKNDPVSVTYYAMDLSNPDEPKRLYTDLTSKGIDIDFLINNAGFGLSGTYCDMDWEGQQQMFALDMLTVAYLTHSFGADMKRRGFGRILNVASTAAFMAIPNLAGYAASKAFVLSLSDAVNSRSSEHTSALHSHS